MFCLMSAFFAVLSLQLSMSDRQVVAATEAALHSTTSEDSTLPPDEPSLIQKATDGLSKLSGLSNQPVVNSADEANQSEALVWMRLSRNYLADYVQREVNREKPARDQVLGITFTGESQTTGNTHLLLRPSEDGAVGEVVFEGKIRSRTSGRKGPVTLNYLAHSNVRAKKQILIGETGFETRQSTAHAPTRLTLVGVDTSLPRLRGRIARRVASRRAAASWSQANAIVSDHRERDTRKSFDERLDKRIAEIQSQVDMQIAALKLGDEHEHAIMRSRSTPQFIEVAFYRGRGDVQPRQAMPRFEVVGNPDIAVRVHRSMLAHVVADAELRARFAPVVASVLQNRLVPGDILSREDKSRLPPTFVDNGWLKLDIVDATEIGAARIAMDQSVGSEKNVRLHR
jgi:hypothetical protein